MAAQKTVENAGDVDAFLAGIEDEKRRADALAVCRMMRESTGEPPAMWGASIVGFERKGDWFVVGFSPRKQATTLYLGTLEGRDALRERLGKHTVGKGCLYVERLSDVDPAVLRELIDASVADQRGR